MLPAFFMAMYEKDGQPFEKVVRNIVRAKLLRPGVRPYRTENLYAPFARQVEKRPSFNLLFGPAASGHDGHKLTVGSTSFPHTSQPGGVCRANSSSG